MVALRNFWDVYKMCLIYLNVISIHRFTKELLFKVWSVLFMSLIALPQ